MDLTKRHAFLTALSLLLIFFMLTVSALSQMTETGGGSILGFTRGRAAHEIELEQKFKAIPSPDEERRQHRIFTAEPHIAGSKRNNELARYIADEWRKQGLEDVIIRRYDVYSTFPKSSLSGDGSASPLSRDSARATL